MKCFLKVNRYQSEMMWSPVKLGIEYKTEHALNSLYPELWEVQNPWNEDFMKYKKCSAKDVTKPQAQINCLQHIPSKRSAWAETERKLKDQNILWWKSNAE